MPPTWTLIVSQNKRKKWKKNNAEWPLCARHSAWGFNQALTIFLKFLEFSEINLKKSEVYD